MRYYIAWGFAATRLVVGYLETRYFDRAAAEAAADEHNRNCGCGRSYWVLTIN